MADESSRRMSRGEAERVWRRAAELQARAAERVERRARLASGASADGDGLALDDVRAAAVEAGIGDEFVQIALNEVSAKPTAGSDWIDRSARAFLGDSPEHVDVARTIAAPPAVVYAAMQRILPNPPFSLVLRDTRGGDPLSDGVLLFDVEQPAFKSSFQWEMEMADIKQVMATLRPAGDGGCHVALRASLTRRGLNLALGSGLTALTGAGATAWGLAASTALIAGPLAGMAAAVPVGFGLAGAGLAVAGYRRIYRWAVGRGAGGLDRLLAAVVVDIKTDGAFTPRPRASRAEVQTVPDRGGPAR